MNGTMSKDDLALTCATICDYNRQLGEHFEAIGDLKCRRSLALQTLFESQGRAMVERGQKSMTLRCDDGAAYKIEAGISHPPICACHGAFLGDCDTIGTVTTLPGPARPYVKVKPLYGEPEDVA